MSLGSIRELETLIEIAGDLEDFSSSAEILAKLSEISKMLMSFIGTIQEG